MSQRGIFHEKPLVFTIPLVAINAKRFPVINVDTVDICSGTTRFVKNVGGKYDGYRNFECNSCC